MNTFDTIIRARSEREAMDWSLVLVSQGIETVIENSPEAGGWMLLVSELDYVRAKNTIRQYRLENRRKHWRSELKWTGLMFDLRAVFPFLILVGVYWAGQTRSSIFDTLGRMDSAAVGRGEWWRLFTAISLHADVAHLAANVTTGVFLLALAMGAYGAGEALLASYLAGAIGNVSGLLLHGEGYRSLGASGLVMGALGLLTVHSLSFRHHVAQTSQLITRAVFAGLLLLVLLGLNPRSDVIAHVGGFAGGCLVGLILVLMPAVSKVTKLRPLAGLAAILLFLLTWSLALRSAR